MTTPLSNSEIHYRLLKLKDDNDEWVVRAISSPSSVYALEKFIEQVCNESRKDELKQLWNYTQSDIVPEGAKPNDMSDRLHERIKTLTKESES